MQFLKSRVGIALRWYYALIGVWIVYDLVRRVQSSESVVLVLGLLLIGFALLISIAILTLPELLPIIASPFLAFIDQIYLPVEKAEKPPLDYRVADHHEATMQWTKLAESYEHILRHYPKERKVYRGLVELYETVVPRPYRARWLRLRARIELSKTDYTALRKGE